MAFLIENGYIDTVNEGIFSKFKNWRLKRKYKFHKSDGSKMFEKALNSFNKDDLSDVKMIAKLNGQYYPITEFARETINSCDAILFNVNNIDAKMGDAMTLHKFSDDCGSRNIKIIGGKLKYWCLRMADPSVIKISESFILDETASDPEDPADDVIVSDVLENIIKSKDEKYLIFRFQINKDIIKRRQDKAKKHHLSGFKF